MSDWITLTPTLFYEVLSGTQQETVNARPHQGTVLDPLRVSLADATEQIRAAIRSNGLNLLSADETKIPPQLRQCGIAIALRKLQQIWPLFRLGKEQESLTDTIKPTLEAVASGSFPVTVPADPQPQNTQRRTTGVTVTRHRATPLRKDDLCGL